MSSDNDVSNTLAIDTVVEADYKAEGLYYKGVITKLHRNDCYSIKYDDGETERRVPRDRIRVFKKSSPRKKTITTSSKFHIGDKVQVLLPEDEEDDDQEGWVPAKVTRVHSNKVTYTVLYTNTEEKETKVPEERIRLSKPSSPLKKKKKSSSSSDDDNEEKKEVFKVGSKVQVADEEDANTWYNAKVTNVRNSGASYDVQYEDDDEEEEENNSEKKVASNRVRKYLGLIAKGTRVQYKVDSEWKNGVIKKIRDENTYDIESSSEKKTIEKRVDRHSIKVCSKWSNLKALTNKSSSSSSELTLKEDLAVRFKDKKGKWHAGHIVRVRSHGEAADIEHDSEDERVSTRISKSDISTASASNASALVANAASAFSTKVKSTASTMISSKPTPFVMNATVEYQDDDLKHSGTIVRVRDKDELCYDIQHDSDDEFVAKKIPHEAIKNKNRRFKLPSSLLSAFNVTHSVGTEVLFKKGSSNYWIKGTVLRVKNSTRESDGVAVNVTTYDIEYQDPRDDDDGETLIAKNVLRSDVKSSNKSTSTESSLKVGATVEVCEKKNRDAVYIATIKSVQKPNTLFTVTYEDGDVERNVDVSRIKISTTKMRIGNEVTLINELSNVKREKGRIEWIHQDQKVVFRASNNTGDEDNAVVVPSVPRRSLILPGGNTGSSHVIFTTKELILFVLNVIFEIIVYGSFAYGVGLEVSHGFATHFDTGRLQEPDVIRFNAAFTNVTLMSGCLAERGHGGNDSLVIVPESAVHTERAWLLASSIASALSLGLFVPLVLYILYQKVQMLQDGYVDFSEQRLDFKLRKIASYLMLIMISSSVVCLIVYTSLLNKLEHYCLWDLQDAIEFDIASISLTVNPFVLREEGGITLASSIMIIAGKTCLNLLKGLTFFIMMESSRSLLRRTLASIPAVFLTSVISIKTLATVHVFHYTQRLFVTTGDFELNSDLDVAILMILCSVWINGAVMHMCVTAREMEEISIRRDIQGDVSDKALAMAEAGELGALAKEESVQVKIDRLKQRLGLCRLSMLALSKWYVMHFIVVAVGFASNLVLQSRLGDITSRKVTVWSSYTTTDLVMNIVFLVILVVLPCGVSYIRRMAPEVQNIVPGGI